MNKSSNTCSELCFLEVTNKTDIAPIKNAVTRVIVIGAGFAGITIANVLKTHGIDVVVVEANTCIGGRTKTILMDNIKVETGAAWIHSPIGNPLSELATAFSLEQKKFSLSDIYSNLQLVNEQGDKVSSLKLESIMELADIIEEKLMKSVFNYSQKQTIAELLELELLNISDIYLRDWVKFILKIGFEADLATEIKNISLANYSINPLYEGEDDRIIEGYSTMLDLLAKDIKIYCDSEVSEIIQTTDEVTVHCTNGYIEKGSNAVVCVPLGVLKSDKIKFTPDLSIQKRDAIKNIGFGHFEKLILKFDQAFWKTINNDIKGILVQGDHIFPYWIDISHDGDSPILAAHISGSMAEKFSKLSLDEVIEKALKILREIYGEAVTTPINAYRTNWSENSFFQGAYTHIPPSSSIRDLQYLSEPENRLLFAGEASSVDRFGYVDGAFISGIRESARLIGQSSVKISILK